MLIYSVVNSLNMMLCFFIVHKCTDAVTPLRFITELFKIEVTEYFDSPGLFKTGLKLFFSCKK